MTNSHQGNLLELLEAPRYELPAGPLASFDVILVNTSAGKDSQAMLDYIVELADAEGIRDRIVAVHCDLGRVEWAGTAELAAEQAAHYGVRFELVSRPQGDLLDQIEARGMFPSSTARYCTSDHKTAQVKVLMTRLVAEIQGAWRAAGTLSPRPVRILNTLGLRAEESPARAKKVAVLRDSASNTKRDVVRWHPILDWTVEQVWARIAAAGTRSHEAYALGMTRLSCAFCVLASRADLQVAAKANRPLLDEYVAVELRIGHRFTMALSAAELAASVDAELEAPVSA
jgi:3'-phosphoadenosine 5'-phosphosulfate sulfotransferase (PAPS reductase)/FAD synthetase